MKKFQFNLETVLKERKRKEDMKLRDWSMAQRAVQILIDQKVAMETRLDQVIQEGNELAAMPDNRSNQFYAIDQFVNGTRLKIMWKENEVHRGQKLADKLHGEYIKARQKRKILEKLKEKKFEEFRDAKRKRELKDLDDLYIMRSRFHRHEEDEEVSNS